MLPLKEIEEFQKALKNDTADVEASQERCKGKGLRVNIVADCSVTYTIDVEHGDEHIMCSETVDLSQGCNGYAVGFNYDTKQVTVMFEKNDLINAWNKAWIRKHENRPMTALAHCYKRTERNATKRLPQDLTMHIDQHLLIEVGEQWDNVWEKVKGILKPKKKDGTSDAHAPLLLERTTGLRVRI